MITNARYVKNEKWLNGMIYNVEICDRFGRNHSVIDHVVGKTFRGDLNDPYKEIQWTNHYKVLLIGQTEETIYNDFTKEFDCLEDALKFMWDNNDHYCGQIYQTRILSNGRKDTCAVTYNGCLYTGEN